MGGGLVSPRDMPAIISAEHYQGLLWRGFMSGFAEAQVPPAPGLNPRPQAKTRLPSHGASTVLRLSRAEVPVTFPLTLSATPDVAAKGGFIENRTWDESSWMLEWIDREECAKCLMQEDFVKQNRQSREVYSLLPESIEMETSGALMGWRSPTTTTTSAMASFFPTMSSIHIGHESEHGCASGRQLWGTQWLM